jgi:hypothetical protein
MTPDEYRAAVVGTAAVTRSAWARCWPTRSSVVARLYVNVTRGPRYCDETMFIPRARSRAPAARSVERVIEVERCVWSVNADARATRHETGIGGKKLAISSLSCD